MRASIGAAVLGIAVSGCTSGLCPVQPECDASTGRIVADAAVEDGPVIEVIDAGRADAGRDGEVTVVLPYEP